jgi:hypothetical protein
MYTDRVRYAEQLRRYHEAFGRDRVLVLIYDDFRADNEACVRQVLRFLEVDEDAPLSLVEANPSVAVRAARADLLVRDVREGRSPATRALRGSVRALTSERIRKAVLYPLRRRVVYSAPAVLDPATAAELRRRFKGEVEAAAEYLGRDLVSLWGYDAV